jgi:hypothetical protein
MTDDGVKRSWIIERFWHNGGRMTLVVLLAGVLALGLTASNLYNAVQDDPPIAPIEVRAPFEVTTSPIEQGGDLVMLTDFCNHAEPIVMHYQGEYIEIDTVGLPQRVVAGNEDEVTVPPGCNILPFVVPLPDEVTPGFWYRESVRTYRHDGADFSIETRTQVFEVVPRGE